ncbi:C-GCAxxG-C-C family protein [Candidatus Bathyarchaeota archaeon]|nr:C-GCAxxG-C-C family protein [Candidatus Bathyarchaeota archaeon]
MDKKLEDFVREYFGAEGNCSETVLLAAANEWGIKNSLVPRIATAFGGGIGRQGQLCGALSGGIMAIGIKCGRDVPQDLEARDRSYALARELQRRFRNEFGFVDCHDLIQCDLLTPEGRARQKEIRWEKCGKFIARTTETVLELTKEIQ